MNHPSYRMSYTVRLRHILPLPLLFIFPGFPLGLRDIRPHLPLPNNRNINYRALALFLSRSWGPKLWNWVEVFKERDF